MANNIENAQVGQYQANYNFEAFMGLGVLKSAFMV